MLCRQRPQPVSRRGIPELVRLEDVVDVDPVVRVHEQLVAWEWVAGGEDVAVDALVGEGGEVSCERVGGRVEERVA